MFVYCISNYVCLEMILSLFCRHSCCNPTCYKPTVVETVPRPMITSTNKRKETLNDLLEPISTHFLLSLNKKVEVKMSYWEKISNI